MVRKLIGYGLLASFIGAPAFLAACTDAPAEDAVSSGDAITELEEEGLCEPVEIPVEEDASTPDAATADAEPTDPGSSGGLQEVDAASNQDIDPANVQIKGPVPKPTPTPAPGPPAKPPPRPRPGSSGSSGTPTKTCSCPPPNVRATSAAGCPAPQNVDRTDTVTCTPATAPSGNYVDPSGNRWQCAGQPHHPCIPSARNGGNATHTHHDRIEYNFGNGCCWKKLKKDIAPVTCASPP